MSKKFMILMLSVGLAAVLGFGGFGIWHASKSTPRFDQNGYILQGEEDEVKWHAFQSGEKYAATLAGTINFKSEDEGEVSVAQQSFAHFEDDSMMALSDGVLLDFNDLSENYINNYYINAGLPIAETGDTYTADTNAGSMEFGEHLWKLSDQKYLIAAPSLEVHMTEDDIRDAEGYVQVVMTEDNVAHMLTQENLWMTISDECYIETQGGVKVYPMTQIIDDGTNKLSLAKLAVSPEDAIVLTEDETRRQIVPELNIEAIDGADGRDGEDGQVGEDGQIGEDGQNGEKGEDGQQGTTGVTGNTGVTGATGSSGASGVSGSSGAKGKDGKNAVLESTTNSALPTMSITDWRISATELKGAIRVTDNGGFLGAINDIEGHETKYPGSVTITNVKTGQVITCYQQNDEYTLHSGDTSFPEFYVGKETVTFSTPANALEPDTEYKLSVTAYYKATDDTGLIYSREFISRFFYTDSTGVTLTQEKAETEKLTVMASVSESYQASMVKTTVFLLTPEQNESFTKDKAGDAANYTAKKEITAAEFGTGNWSADAEFAELAPNTQYIARALVATNAGLTTLTTQELNLKTLKRTPAKKTETDSPKAYYNRVTGAFEVYRPPVTDPDGGTVSYTYTAYKLTASNQWQKVAARSVTPAMGEPVEFHLQSGEVYQFGVELEFHDNEKLVYYDLGRSDSIASAGETMPKVTLEGNLNATDYNKYDGTIKVHLTNKSAVTVDALHPLTLEFYADQIWNAKAELPNGSPVTLEKRGTVTYDAATSNKNELNIKLQLKDLYKNTNYTVTVSGYLDLGDGNGAVNRAIGTVSFRTYDPLNLSATWSVPSTVSTAFARTLSLSVQDSSSTEVRKNYALEQLKEGQVTVELFSGTGTGKLRIAQKNFNQTEDLAKLFSTAGLEITEESFGGPPLNRDGNYTLTVTTVADGSYGRNLGYINTFDNLQNASEVVSAEPTPPDLLTDSSKGIKAAPIYNKDAVSFGATVDKELPDEAIIGYTLESTYDNVQRIGKTITYYAFEYNTFFNALRNNQDPIEKAKPLIKMTQPIDISKDTVPKIALLFGGTETKDQDSTMYNGYQRYYAGAPNKLGNVLDSGMDRGYRYIFAYTVQYASSGSGESEAVRVYPYNHKSYQDYNTYYGGVKENNKQIGKGIAYILNSGMCEAPKIMPDFHTYVFSTEQDQLASASATTAGGKVTLHYTWRDPDKRIVTNETDAANTKISFPKDSNGTLGQANINGKVKDGNWYEVTLPYTISSKTGGSETVLTPTVNVSEYELDYDEVLRSFDLPKDVKDYPIAQIPLDWSWAQQFNKKGYQGAVFLNIQAELDKNHIDFYLTGGTGGDTAMQALISRAVAMELTVKTTDTAHETKTFTLPLNTDVKGTYARLTTGLLGTAFLNKEFEVTARMLYDTGVQGWDVLENEGKRKDGFALQYINDATSRELFGFSAYIGASNSTTIPGNGALLNLTSTSTGFETQNLRNLIASELEDDDKYSLYTSSKVGNASALRYLYPTRMGVDVHNSLNVENLSGQYIVPKQIADYPLKFTGDNKVTLTTLTPTVTKPYFEVSSTTVKPVAYKVSGFADGGQIYMAAYTSREAAESLNTQYDGRVEINVNENGVPDAKELTGLTAGKKYYMTFYYKKADGTLVKLLRSDTAEDAIFEVTTSTQAIIDITKMDYLNTGYFDKLLLTEFSISRLFNLNMSYDIYASAEDAAAGQNPVLTYDQMVTGDENEILKVPPIIQNNDNKLRLNLTPSQLRERLVPGVTYYLKIRAYEPAAVPDGTPTEAGSAIQPFTITSVGNLGALIYVQHAGDKSITFRVIINDPQFTLMGRPNNDNEGALYAVRFTDKAGNVLRTSYDNQVYSASEKPYQDFILDDAHLVNDSIATNSSIQTNEEYHINIYAVPDRMHNGQIILDSQPKTWSDFFDAKAVTARLEECGSRFLKIIQSFWETNTSNDSSKDEMESQLLIASKLQSTTTESGWLLNEKGVYASRYNTETVRIMLEESFGLIQKTTGTGGGSTEEPVFKRIDWQVEGFKSDGSPLDLSGQSLRSKGDKLLQESQIASNYNSYFFDIPAEVVQGSYTIVLQFYEAETDSAPKKTITIRSGV